MAVPPPPGWAQYRDAGHATKSWRDVGRMIAAIMMATFGVYLVVCLFTLVHGIDIVVPELEHRSFTQYFAFIGVSPLVTMSGSVLQGWYFFLIAAILASAVWLLVRSGSRYIKEITMKAKPRDHSPFFDMCGLMFAIFFVNTVIVLTMSSLGSEPATPVEDTDTWELLFLLANASVWEELLFRVLYIGLPLAAAYVAMTRDFKKIPKYLLGGGITIGAAEVALVLISGILFGFAHFEGWGAWKIFPSGLAGVAFGYMFLRHGLAAAIMLHFSFDYLSMPLVVFEDSLGLLLVVGVGILLWLAVGAVFVVYYGIRLTEFVTKKTFFDVPTGEGAIHPLLAQRSPQLVYGDGRGPPQYPPRGATGAGTYTVGGRPIGPDGGFICPACGWTAARWLSGSLQCMRCGRIFK